MVSFDRNCWAELTSAGLKFIALNLQIETNKIIEINFQILKNICCTSTLSGLTACFEALNLPYSTQESGEEAPQDNFTDFLRNFPNEFVLISPDLDRGASSRAGGRRKEINRVRGMRLGYLLCTC